MMANLPPVTDHVVLWPMTQARTMIFKDDLGMIFSIPTKEYGDLMLHPEQEAPTIYRKALSTARKDGTKRT